ncbi:MAG: FHA domain-containing protein [Chromatiales bacterium]|nr:FHA domain-containing protein [Chromatiales bacterium]
MLDAGEPIYISREHLRIELSKAGSYWVHDRGSVQGTVVDDNWLGGNRQGARASLEFDSLLGFLTLPVDESARRT